MKLGKEQVKTVGNVGLRIGKAIVVEGTKALVLKTAAKYITTSFDSGFEGVKKIRLDDVLKGDKEKKSAKFKVFSFKKKETPEESVETEVTKETETTEG